MNVTWILKSFDELNVYQLYEILRLRAEVFVVEQNCPYQDLDSKDIKSFHLIGTNEKNELIAYSRILPPNVSYNEASIGRVVTSQKYRKKGAGKELMKKSIDALYEKFGQVPIRIGAQLYLKIFYENFGFSQEGEQYLEDNIPHIIMLKK